MDIILKQDLIDLESVSGIKQVELLLDLLKERSGNPISYLSLAQNLQVSDKTIKRWLDILESMYVIFKITPYSKKVSKSILKQPKYYFYDVVRTKNEGARLENIVAASLLKEVNFRQDCLGESWNLFYLAKKGGVELDFLITKNDKPYYMIETKMSDDSPSPNFKIFEKDLGSINKIQLVHKLKREKTFSDGTEIRKLGEWLKHWR